jgi:hypothetical protein
MNENVVLKKKKLIGNRTNGKAIHAKLINLSFDVSKVFENQFGN